MAPKESDVMLDIGMPLIVMTLMAGMGATLVPHQVKEALRKPQALLCGMLSQFLIMPSIGYALYKILGLQDAQAIGLIIVACTPGGTTSNLFTYWSKGDVALSICMTVCSTLAALVMMPLMIGLLTSGAMDRINKNKSSYCVDKLLLDKKYTVSDGGVLNQYCWDAMVGSSKEQSCQTDWLKCSALADNTQTESCLRTSVCHMELDVDHLALALGLILITIPAAFGLWTRTREHQKWLADSIQSIGNNAGILVIVAVMFAGIFKYQFAFEASWKVWFAAIFVGNLGFFFGYNLARISGLSVRQCRTVSLETGIQNGPVAIGMAQLAFPHCTKEQFGTSECLQSEVLLFPMLYSLFIVLQSIGVCVCVYQRSSPEPKPTVPALQSTVTKVDETEAEGVTADGDDMTATGALPRRHHSLKGGDLMATIPLARVLEIQRMVGGKSEAPKPASKSAVHSASSPAREELAAQEVTTLWNNFTNAACLYSRKRYLGSRSRVGKRQKLHGPYVWLSFSEAYSRARMAGAGLRCLGVPAGGKVALLSQNRAEWMLTAHGCDAHSIATVPLYATLGPDAVEFILNQTEATVVAAAPDGVAQLQALHAAGKLPFLHTVVDFGALQRPQQAQELSSVRVQSGATEQGGGQLQVISWATLLKLGDEALGRGEHAPEPPSADTLALICYTSGTTGIPKGAMLTHGNMIASTAGAISHFETAGFRLLDDVHISYLPLAHIFERTVMTWIVATSSCAGFSSGDPKFLMKDMIILKPTIFVSVPRLLNRLVDKIIEGVDKQKGWCCWGPDNPSLYMPGDSCGKLVSRCKWPPPSLKKLCFHKGYKAKVKNMKEANTFENGFWDSSVFQAISNRLGGRVRVIMTGSAPISPQVLEFLRICFRCPVVEGYGATECGAACTVQEPYDLSAGHVGPPIAANEIKLAPLPEMGYLPTDVATCTPGSEHTDLQFGADKDKQLVGTEHERCYPRGEICVRGPNVFQGYYKNEAETAKALDQDGWLHTGDVGVWLPGGKLRIVDRVKNIFKLSQGEYVAPEKIEIIYRKSAFVDQVFVYGDSMQHQLVAVVVPDFLATGPWLQSNLAEHIGAFTEAKAEEDGPKSALPPPPPAGVGPAQPSAVGAQGATAERERLCQNSSFRSAVLLEMRQLGKEAGLHGFEQVKHIHLEHSPFTVEQGLLTATFKAKRPALRDHYRTVIDRLYVELAGNS